MNKLDSRFRSFSNSQLKAKFAKYFAVAVVLYLFSAFAEETVYADTSTITVASSSETSSSETLGSSTESDASGDVTSEAEATPENTVEADLEEKSENPEAQTEKEKTAKEAPLQTEVASAGADNTFEVPRIESLNNNRNESNSSNGER